MAWLGLNHNALKRGRPGTRFKVHTTGQARIFHPGEFFEEDFARLAGDA